MAYEKTTWKNREVERPRTFEKIDNPDGTITLVPAEGNIIEPGTPIIAANMNNIEQGIEDAHDLAQQAFQSASDGKVLVAGAITGKGVPTAPSDTFSKMATNINNIVTDPSVGTTDAVASDILKGKKAVSQGNLLTGSLELTANALAAQVLAGVTFYNTNPKNKLTGTMPNRGAPAQTLTTQGGQYNIPAGYYSGGSVKAQFANLTPENVKSGVSVGGVVGNLEAGWMKIESNFPISGAIGAIGYANNLWVVGSWDGKLITSPDAITWTERSTPVDIANAVAYGNGIWVMVGRGGSLATSTNGTTWTSRTSSFEYTEINDVAFGNGMFVAVSGEGKIATSTNGTTWTQVTSGFHSYDRIQGVAYGNGMWVVVTNRGESGTSTNGTTWTKRASFSSMEMNKVTYDNGIWIAVGNSGYVATSTNGTTWTQRTSSFGTSNIRSVSYGNGMWRAGGVGGKMAKSTNGTTWTQGSSSFGVATIYDIAYGNGIWVAGGSNGIASTLS